VSKRTLRIHAGAWLGAAALAIVWFLGPGAATDLMGDTERTVQSTAVFAVGAVIAALLLCVVDVGLMWSLSHLSEMPPWVRAVVGALVTDVALVLVVASYMGQYPASPLDTTLGTLALVAVAAVAATAVFCGHLRFTMRRSRLRGRHRPSRSAPERTLTR